MCGLTGFSGKFSKKLLTQMIEKIKSRGPDDRGDLYFSLPDGSGFLGLGHTRLAILDLSQEGHQPMSLKCPCCQMPEKIEQKVWIVFNGEIYNFLELKNNLISDGHVFFSQTDTEVLLHLYIKYGIEFLNKLNGMFALSIYDGRSQEIFLARDPMGIKPLYYSENSEGVLFSSELKSLLESDSVSRNLDLTAIHNYLTFLWSPGERTPCEKIKKLLPGQYAVIKHSRIIKKEFFYDIPLGNQFTGTYQEAIGLVQDGLKTAVKRQLISDVPVGTFLSGGVDSSAIVAMMRGHMPEAEIHAYVIDAENKTSLDGKNRDVDFAREVAGQYKINLHELNIQPSLLDSLEHMIERLDEPQADPAALNVELIARQARKDGITVLLSGSGGDDIFSGYRRHQALLLDKYLERTPSFLRSLVGSGARKLQNGHGYFMNHANLRRIVKGLVSIDQSRSDRLKIAFEWSNQSMRESIFQPEVFRAHEDTLQLSLDRLPPSISQLDKMLYLECKHFLVDHNLNYTDKMSMSCGVEVRVPFLDLDLVKLAFLMPDKFKMHNNIPKGLLKDAMSPYLSQKLLHREKTGFGAPLRQWMRGELKNLMHEVFESPITQSRGIFNTQNVLKLLDLELKGRVDASYVLFSALCVELWCRRFVDPVI